MQKIHKEKEKCPMTHLCASTAFEIGIFNARSAAISPQLTESSGSRAILCIQVTSILSVGVGRQWL